MQDTLNATQETATVSSDSPPSNVTLLNLTNFPPGGWRYREVALNWTNPDPLNGEGFEHAVALIQMVRAQNPAANLDPSFNACAEALIRYTCARLHYDPRFCGLPPLEQQILNAKNPQYGRKCASCGRR